MRRTGPISFVIRRRIEPGNTPDLLAERVNLLLMAGQMDSTLRGEIVGAVGAIPVPTGNQNAINAALTARVQSAIYLTMASPAFCAQF